MKLDEMLTQLGKEKQTVQTPDDLAEKLYRRGNLHDRLDHIGFIITCLAIVVMIGLTLMPTENPFRMEIASLEQGHSMNEEIGMNRGVQLDVVKIAFQLSIRVSLCVFLFGIPLFYLKERKESFVFVLISSLFSSI